MLCKRKYEVVEDDEIAVAMLYSHSQADFFAGCARSGYPFVQSQPGVMHSSQLPLSFYAVDLVAIGELQPDHPINLLSARRRSYGAAGLPSRLGPFAVLYEELFLREMKKMGQLHVPGYEELLDDARRTRELVIAQSSTEERLRGMKPEERLRGIEPEELLRGLKPEAIARLRELLLKQDAR